MRWWMFGLSGLLAVLVAFITVSFHTIRAANANPVRSLKAE
jgi:putative ABC transport system permease protein